VIKVKVVVSSYDEGYFIEGYFVGYVKACAWWKNGNEVWRKSTVCVSFRRDADGARSCLSSFTGISFASGTLPWMTVGSGRMVEVITMDSNGFFTMFLLFILYRFLEFSER
jgi:hypothetical protein